MGRGDEQEQEILSKDVLDSIAQIADSMSVAVAQLAQITQGATTKQVSGQMTGQRVDRSDVSANATKQDVGSDELKDMIGGLQSARTLDTGSQISQGGMTFAKGIEAIMLGTIQVGQNLGSLITAKATENVLGVNVTDLAEASAVKALEAKGYTISKKQ